MTLRYLGLGVAALAAWGTMGCSDPAKPDPVASVFINIGSASSTDTPPGSGCTITPHSAQIGVVPPSGQDKGKPVTDGDNASVSCSVGDGSQIKFRGSASKGAVSFFVAGTVAKGGKGTAVVQEYDPQGDQLQSPSDKPCNVYVDTKPLTAGGSKIWARFDCPGLTSQNNPTLYCAASDSYFFFDNCD